MTCTSKNSVYLLLLMALGMAINSFIGSVEEV